MNIDSSHLISLLGNEAAAQRFINIFLQELPEQKLQLLQSFEKGDWETLSLTAHGMKSQFRYLGLHSEGDLLQKLEADPQNEQAKSWIKSLVLIMDNLLQT